MKNISRLTLLVTLTVSAALAEGNPYEQELRAGHPAFETYKDEYGKMEENVCNKLASCIENDALDTHIYIKTAGYIRTRKALGLLCDNLGFPAKPPSGNNLSPRRWDAQLPYVGVFKWPMERFPAIGAIEQIGGLQLDKLLHMVDLEPKGLGIAEIMADLSFVCGGEYYTKAVIDHFPSNHWYGAKVRERASLYGDLGKPRNKQWEFSRQNGLFLTNFDEHVCARYDAMQETLLAQFAEETAKSAQSITNTIAILGRIRSPKAIPILAENLTICPLAPTNDSASITFPAAEALIAIIPNIGYCFEQLGKTSPLTIEEALWLRISHELYPESLEYGLSRLAATNDTRAARLLGSLPWRRLTDEEMLDP